MSTDLTASGHRVLSISAVGATLAALVCTSAGALASPGSSSAGPRPSASSAKTANVKVGDFFFSPAKTKIKPGGTVHWTWIGKETHNVTITALHKHSKDQKTGTFQQKFAHAGTYHYLCTIHGFTGTVTVR